MTTSRALNAGPSVVNVLCSPPGRHPFRALAEKTGVRLSDVFTQLRNGTGLMFKTLVVLPELKPLLIIELDVLNHQTQRSYVLPILAARYRPPY